MPMLKASVNMPSICQPQSQEARTEAAGCGHPKGSGSAKKRWKPHGFGPGING